MKTSVRVSRKGFSQVMESLGQVRLGWAHDMRPFRSVRGRVITQQDFRPIVGLRVHLGDPAPDRDLAYVGEVRKNSSTSNTRRSRLAARAARADFCAGAADPSALERSASMPSGFDKLRKTFLREDRLRLCRLSQGTARAELGWVEGYQHEPERGLELPVGDEGDTTLGDFIEDTYRVSAMEASLQSNLRSVVGEFSMA